MTFNWCHGPNCHTTETQSRVRGSKGNKVLRTIKIKLNRYGNYQSGIWNHFCNQRCLMAFLSQFANEVVAIAPVREPSETPIKVEKEKYETMRWTFDGNGNGNRVPRMATRTKIIGGNND